VRSSSRCTNKETGGVRHRRKSACAYGCAQTVADVTSAARYFKNYKLDYPNTETQKGSKKFVKAMKKLHVSITLHPDAKDVR
jgi:3-methyladenine DNA glycosylase Tag